MNAKSNTFTEYIYVDLAEINPKDNKLTRGGLLKSQRESKE